MKSNNIHMKEIENWSEEQLNAWIETSEWGTSFSVKPDEGMDKRLFVQQNLLNPTAWKAALDFLKRPDLKSLPEGRYDLTAEGAYAALSEYTTKEWDTARYEAHRKYIDIQYVSAGEEYIEVLPLASIREEQKYDPEADIMFFDDRTEGTKLLADPSCFFVFFPSNAHKPCLKIEEAKAVKKIVVKIPLVL